MTAPAVDIIAIVSSDTFVVVFGRVRGNKERLIWF